MAIPDDFTNTDCYETRIFDEGIYAVTSAYMHEIEERMNQLIKWVENSDIYELDKYNGEFKQEPMSEIITPWEIVERFNIEQQDLFVQIRLRENK